MLLYLRILVKAGRILDQNLESAKTENCNNTLLLGYSYDAINLPDEGNLSTNPDRHINSLTKEENKTRCHDGFSSNFNNDFQQQSDSFQFYHNFSNDYSYYDISAPSDQDFKMKYDETIYVNTLEESHEYLPTFTTLRFKYNFEELKLPAFSTRGENISNLDTECDNTFSTLSISNQVDGSLFMGNKTVNDKIDKTMQQIEKNLIIMSDDQKSRKRDSDSENSTCENNSNSSSAINSSKEEQTFNNEAPEQMTSVLYANQSPVTTIKVLAKKLIKAIHNLNIPKAYSAKFLKSKVRNESFRSSLCSDLMKITEDNDYIKKICKRWVENEEFIEDSVDNRNIFNKLLRIALDIRNTINIFGNSLCKNILTLSNKNFNMKNKILKNRIERNRKSIERLKMLGVERVFENKNSGNILNSNQKTREITFLYQEKNNSNIQIFKIFIKKNLYPAINFSVFKESIYLCICGSRQHLKIFIIDLKTNKHREIDTYEIFKEDNYVNYKHFGYGYKNVIIRSGSEGKLFLLRSPGKKPLENITYAKNNFEMLVVNLEFKLLALMKVDSRVYSKNTLRPAIIDFVVHDNFVYALDMNCRCVKIFSEYLEFLKMIPIPESLVERETINLAVSSKFILIGAERTIYYISNNDQYSEFKTMEFSDILLNIAFIDEEHVIVRFTEKCYSFRIEENLSDVKFIHLASLDQLSYLHLTNFTVKDNFVYSFCVKSDKIIKLNLSLNSTSAIIH